MHSSIFNPFYCRMGGKSTISAQDLCAFYIDFLGNLSTGNFTRLDFLISPCIVKPTEPEYIKSLKKFQETKKFHYLKSLDSKIDQNRHFLL